NSRGAWETMREWVWKPVREIVAPAGAVHGPHTAPHAADQRHATRNTEHIHLVPVLSIPSALERIGTGTLCVIADGADGKTSGRALTVADRLKDDRVILAKWIRRLTNWNGRQAPLNVWRERIAPLVEQRLAQQTTPLVRFVDQAHK